MFRKIITWLCMATLVLCMFSMNTSLIKVSAESDSINNSDLVTKYVPDNKVTLDENGTPDWVSSLIMAEVRLATCTSEGTIQAAVSVLDHYQEMGVNGLWITPVNDRGLDENGKFLNNGYGNLGPDTIDTTLTGTTDYTEGWKIFNEFVQEAHKRNIRIFLDVISWGVDNHSYLYQQHPEWFNGILFGGKAYDWSNEEFKSWYINTIVDVGVKSGVDGFRYDVEPCYAGYAVDKTIREKLTSLGRKMAYFSEMANDRNGAYDFEENGTGRYLENGFINGKYNIVDSVQTGEGIGSDYAQTLGISGESKYYTCTLSHHDNTDQYVKGSRLAIGYQAIFSPFIPLWYIGDEWNNPVIKEGQGATAALYFTRVDWNQLEVNRAFYEDVKKMIRVRLQYPEIFSQYAENHRDSNICKVSVTGLESLQAYARFTGDTGIIIVPNNNLHNADSPMTVYVPFEDMKMAYYESYVISDAYTGKVIAKGSIDDVYKFQATVNYDDVGAYIIKGYNPITLLADTSSTSSSSVDNVVADQSDNADTTTTVKVKVKKPTSDTSNSGLPTWAIVLIIVGGVIVVAGGTLTTIFLIRKKKKKLIIPPTE